MNEDIALNKFKRKYIMNFGGQMKYFKKKKNKAKITHKTEDYSDISIPLPPILAKARINTQLETINMKYTNKPQAFYPQASPKGRNVSLPALKLSINDGQEKIKEKINNYLQAFNQPKLIVKNDFLKQSMIAYSKISTIMI